MIEKQRESGSFVFFASFGNLKNKAHLKGSHSKNTTGCNLKKRFVES